MRDAAMGPRRRGGVSLPGQLAAGLLLALAAIGCGKGNEQQTSGNAPAQAGATAAPASGASASAGAQTASAESGAQIFQRCATCHQPTGLGVAGTYPPLAGSEWVNAADPATPISIILHGFTGPITVRGQSFTSTMPPYGTGQPMSDAEVAAVLTYERSSWGNHASAVTPQQVAQARQATASRTTPWTSAELKP